MKTKGTIWLAAFCLALFASGPVAAGPNRDARIAPGGCVRPDLDLEVYVWPDRGIDAVYHPGDPIRIFFEVTRDCYVVLYDIDTRGRLHILFPFDPWQDNFVRAGQVYELPGDWDDFQLTVDGPPGTEYVQVIASPYLFQLPDWPIYINSPGHYPATCPDPDFSDFRAGDDRITYIHRINRKLSRHRWEWCATDLARFYVRRRPVRHYYHTSAHLYIDSWPRVFYGEIYIGWPVGARIYVDGIFFGIAPCRISGIPYGYHRIRCFDGDHLVREKRIRYRHKRWYRQDHPDYRIKGKYLTKAYRSAPGIPAGKVDRDRRDRPGNAEWYRTAVRKDTSPLRVDRRSGAVGVSKKTKASRDAYRWPRGSMPETKKVPAPRVSKTKRAGEPSGFAKFVSSLGQGLAEELKKAAGKKRKPAKAATHKLSGKSKDGSPDRPEKNRARRSIRKKQR